MTAFRYKEGSGPVSISTVEVCPGKGIHSSCSISTVSNCSHSDDVVHHAVSIRGRPSESILLEKIVMYNGPGKPFL